VNQVRDTVWQRRGVSWVWDPEAFRRVCKPSEVLSLRQFLRSHGKWPQDPPSNGGDALVVAGLDGALDLLKPDAADQWLGERLKSSVLSFQDAYEGQVALVFWLPGGERRIRVNPASDVVVWACAAPYAPSKLEFGRVLWGAPSMYPQEIMLEGALKPSGLFHLRIT